MEYIPSLEFHSLCILERSNISERGLFHISFLLLYFIVADLGLYPPRIFNRHRYIFFRVFFFFFSDDPSVDHFLGQWHSIGSSFWCFFLFLMFG